MRTSIHDAFVLQVQGLIKRFDQHTVLHDVNLNVGPQEATALIGKNGVGKSTTLRCIIGELPKDQGTITICGADLDLEPLQAKALLGYAADDPFLYPYLSGREHLSLWQAFRSSNADSIYYACDLAAQLSLQDALDTQVRTYSRGMRQKLAFIGALFHRPRLILLDEPFTAMDQESTTRAVALLRAVQMEGTSIVFITHQQMLIEELGAKTLTISEGKTAPGVARALMKQ